MYVCQICNKQQPAGTPCKRIAQHHDYHHPFRSGEPPKTKKGEPKKPSPIGYHWEWCEVWEGKRKVWKWVWTWYDDVGGNGKQIVKEICACPNCAK